ncbi:MAG: stage II sporulation protein M [Nanoarchaeota archaeon]|nr:stage II sporulation protein M [Nanoarchaeota archaeon]
MVFEQIFGPKWLEKKPGLTFLLGFVYAELGIISALLIFPENPSLISIGFISILILPSLNQLLSMETNQDIKRKKFSLIYLFKDHYDILSVYAFLFLGILLAYGIFAAVLPAAHTERVFEVQLDIYFSNVGRSIDPYVGTIQGAAVQGASVAGIAYSQAADFWSIFLNNLKVILVCLVFSLVYGAGSILFLTWNASVWGTIFGYVAKRTADTGPEIVNFFVIMACVFPHMISEALSYFMAVFAGGIISKAVIREKFDSRMFNHVLLDGFVIFFLALVLLLIAAWLEVYIFPFFTC